VELVETRYYEPRKIANTTYIVFMAIEKYIAQEIFKGDASRVMFCSDEFAFRQRINKLYPTLTPPYTSIQANQLQFPFANYFREKNWSMDTRHGIQSPQAALFGIPLSEDLPFDVRFLQTQQNYTMTFYFNRDDDAQNAYDILMWMQNPTPKQFAYSGLKYKNYNIDIPIIFTVENLNWTNEYKEKEWLEENRVITIRASINIKSVLMDQYASGSASNMFEVMPAESEIGQFFITRESILDFMSYKNDPLLNEENIVMDIISQFTPDPTLSATFDVTPITETSATLVWDYNVLALPNYASEVLVMLNNGLQAYVTTTNKTYSFTELEPESTYIANIYFTSLTGQVVKLSKTFETVDPENQKTLKGMIGLLF